jgi:hypothetical protein
MKTEHLLRSPPRIIDEVLASIETWGNAVRPELPDNEEMIVTLLTLAREVIALRGELQARGGDA